MGARFCFFETLLRQPLVYYSLLMDRAFTTGSYYWIYDLEDDGNSFTKDKKSFEYLKKMIQLRKYWLNRFGHGIFRDVKNITCNENTMAKYFNLEQGVLVPFATNDEAVIKVDGVTTDAELVYCDGAKVVSAEISCNENGFFKLKDVKLGLIYFKK